MESLRMKFFSLQRFAYIMQIEFEVAGEHFQRSFVGDVTVIR